MEKPQAEKAHPPETNYVLCTCADSKTDLSFEVKGAGVALLPTRLLNQNRPEQDRQSEMSFELSETVPSSPEVCGLSVVLEDLARRVPLAEVTMGAVRVRGVWGCCGILQFTAAGFV